MNIRRNALPLLAAGLVTLLLLGCAEQPRKRAPPPGAALSAQELAQASALEAAGDFNAAAPLLDRLAQQAPTNQRDDLLLRAAEAWLAAGAPESAAKALDGLRGRPLVEPSALRARLIGAEIALAQGRSDRALEILGAPPSGAPPNLRQRWHQDRADALRAGGNLLESAAERTELDLLLDDPTERLENQLRIVRTLAVMTDTALELLRPQPPGILGGWMDLTRILKTYEADPAAATRALGQWRDDHPSHPALPELMRTYTTEMDSALADMPRVAVLLPLGGRYAGASGAILDGILAAYYTQPAERRPELRIYDTSDPAAALALLEQAADEGATVAIGPLQKEAVEQLARAQELPIRVLALNRVTLEAPPPPELFQFALAPEDEARRAAEKAWLDGAVSALILTPEGSWGERLAASFRERFEALGGRILGAASYDPEKNDFSAQLRPLLRTDEAEAHRKVQRAALGRAADGLPGRRTDVGALFLAATPQKAREIWPQLQFHHAGDLPVYTTSHIYGGRFDPRNDQDLVGLTFVDIPWLLEPGDGTDLSRDRLPESLAGMEGAQARLFALGADSYRLLPRLGQLQEYRASTVVGATGRLYLDDLNQVHRHLVWARMTARGPESLGYPPRLDEPAAAQPAPAAGAPPGDTPPPPVPAHVPGR